MSLTLKDDSKSILQPSFKSFRKSCFSLFLGKISFFFHRKISKDSFFYVPESYLLLLWKVRESILQIKATSATYSLFYLGR